MSSEALGRAPIIARELHHWAAHLDGFADRDRVPRGQEAKLLREAAALLAEVARLEKELADERADTEVEALCVKLQDEAEELHRALAVAREREQRLRELREPIEAAMRWIGGTAVMAPGSRRHSSALAGVLLALGALVDEPAAATEACHICGRPRNEPGEMFCSAGHPLAAAEEPGETP